jgi:hypothetical protein
VSIFFLALDRCFIGCYPFKYRVFMNGKKAMAVIIFQWLFAFLNIALKNDLEKAVAGFRLFSGIGMILISCLLYAKTIYHLKKEAKYLNSQCGIRRRPKKRQREHENEAFANKNVFFTQ